MREGRFGKLERERAVEDVRTGRPSMEARFGEPKAAAPDEDVETEAPTPAKAPRFEAEPSSSPRLRLLDVDEGQSFLRCGRCRADNYLTAARCTYCEADLTTPEQRAFNESFWQQRLEERAEQQQAVERITAVRERAEREEREAARQRVILERELASRRSRGLAWGADGFDWLHEIGDAIGAWLRRSFPDRRLRLVALVTGAGLLAALLWKLLGAGPGVRSALFIGVLLLSIVLRAFRSRG